MLIVDAHLDLSYNAVRGRAVDQPAQNQKPDNEGIPTVGLPDLQKGGVKLICATIFCLPVYDGKPGYTSAEEAHDQLLKQLDWYKRMHDADKLEFVRDPATLKILAADAPPKKKSTTNFSIDPSQIYEEILADQPKPPSKTQAILLLEGADPIRHDGDVQDLFDAGLRMVGLSWRRTRFAGGTAEPGPLTEAGVKLIKTLDRFGIIHDTSHLAEQSFWQLLDLTTGPIAASHSNCRQFVPTDRQLSNEMIRAVAARGGVIGINFFDRFLLPPAQQGKRRATLADVVMHMKYICDLVGNAAHVGLGTDMDGGLGRDEIPLEIQTSADLARVADALAAANFPDEDIFAIMGENWRRFFTENLSHG
jgi:membrane dipeptidase